MSESVEQARRTLFEAWYESRAGYKPRLQESGRYMEIGPALAWDGFNAALDAVEIELPHDVSHVTSPLFEQGRDAVLAAIESTGLGIKIK